MKTLRTDLPDDVWYRFEAEAKAAGVTVGRYLRQLIEARDRRMTKGPRKEV